MMQLALRGWLLLVSHISRASKKNHAAVALGPGVDVAAVAAAEKLLVPPLQVQGRRLHR